MITPLAYWFWQFDKWPLIPLTKVEEFWLGIQFVMAGGGGFVFLCCGLWLYDWTRARVRASWSHMREMYRDRRVVRKMRRMIRNRDLNARRCNAAVLRQGYPKMPDKIERPS